MRGRALGSGLQKSSLTAVLHTSLDRAEGHRGARWGVLSPDRIGALSPARMSASGSRESVKMAS